ncbi:MAG: hypothetical protein KDD56_01535 [Bdellovibrionales bacterium]|nr:hypothetical protein [Bdellovibrionales bacterium]
MKIYFLTEFAFHPSFLVKNCLDTLGDLPEFGGILIRNPKKNSKLEVVKNFENNTRFYESYYGTLSSSELAMLDLYGDPDYYISPSSKVHFIERNLNSDQALSQVRDIIDIRENEKVFILVFLDTILRESWIDFSKGNLVNAHSAVLPYARGMHAIEQVVANGKSDEIMKVSGATVHYIDSGVDTGPIIYAERILNPFQYKSIWHLKAACYMLSFKLLLKVANDLMSNPNTLPVGTIVASDILGPNYLKKDFSSDLQKTAENSFLKFYQKKFDD